MNKKEIMRICNCYNDSRSYALAFGKSIDLGSMEEIIPEVQKNIFSLTGSLRDAWKVELQALREIKYLSHVLAILPQTAVRLTGIRYTPRGETITFSFTFNFTKMARSGGIRIQGIPVIAFGVDISLSGKGPSGKSKLVTFKNKSASEKYIPLKKAS
jgi:hypothetical protein